MAKKRNLRPKKSAIRIFNIVLLGLSAFMLYQVGTEAFTTVRLRQQLATAQNELSTLESENETLTQQKEKLLDPDYVRSYARAQYMLRKEGEQIFYLPKGDETED